MASIVLRVDPSFDPEMYDNRWSWSKTSYICWSLGRKRTEKEKEENIWSLEEQKNTKGEYLEKENCYMRRKDVWKEGNRRPRKGPQRLNKKIEGVEGKE